MIWLLVPFALLNLLLWAEHYATAATKHEAQAARELCKLGGTKENTMADDEKKDYILIEEKDTVKRAISELKRDTTEKKLIAVDCEGVSLSRDGKLTILSLATENKVYIFDVLKLRNSLFDDGLREILENKSIEKLMFDCRQDSDGLWHQFNVKITGVLDMQLLEIMYRRGETTSRGSYPKRYQNVDGIVPIYGYKKCMELYVGDNQLLKTKIGGSQLMAASKYVWEQRPLKEDLIKYCCGDVKGLFKVYESLKQNDRHLDRLRVASERYAERFRGLTERHNDKYEGNAYLPLDIIPDRGTLSFPQATTKCVGCKRLFPDDEFSAYQLKSGKQKCRVCEKIWTRFGCPTK